MWYFDTCCSEGALYDDGQRRAACRANPNPRFCDKKEQYKLLIALHLPYNNHPRQMTGVCFVWLLVEKVNSSKYTYQFNCQSLELIIGRYIGKFVCVNVAVTDLAASTVTIQSDVPVHPPPLQPVKVEFIPATALSVTRVLYS